MSPKAVARDKDGMAAPTTKQMDARGSSDDWQKGQASMLKIGHEFLDHISKADKELSARWGLDWNKVPEHELTEEEIWGHLATFLVETRIIPVGNRNQGKMYDVGSAHGCWGGLLNTSAVRFSKSERRQTQVRHARSHAIACALCSSHLLTHSSLSACHLCAGILP